MVCLVTALMPMVVVFAAHEGDLKDKTRLTFKVTMPMGIMIAAVVAALFTFMSTRDAEAGVITIESDEYLLDDSTSQVLEVFPMRNPADPSNHDTAMSLIILDAGVEITEDGYTNIRAGDDVEYQVYQQLKLKPFGNADLSDTIYIDHQLSEGD